ncbi:MAG: signal peptidase II [Myxococcaceae bacterium]|nr:signal peptidase II [Myxococcaceae bacterium]
MPRRYLLFIVLSVGVVLLDQWTKYFAVDALTVRFDGKESAGAELKALYAAPPPEGLGGYHFTPRGKVEVIPGLLRFRYAENPGAAWGLFRGLPPGIRGPLFHVISIGAVILIVWYFRKLSGARSEAWAIVGLPLVLAGAVGNYIDRIARAFVIDFIEAHWFDKAYWPSFNVADMAICVGVACLVIDAFVRREKKPKAA